MSIYPGGRPAGLRFKFDVAAIDLPVPSDLGEQDAREWKNYCECLSPAQRIRKFGQALDEFHGLMDKAGSDPLKLPEQDQALLYSKWYAAEIAGNVLSQNIYFITAQTYRDPDYLKSDIDQQLFCLTDLLKSVNSPDLKTWEDRRTRHNAIDDPMILPLLNKFSGYRGKKPAPGSAPAP